jgi:hypothetical protein
MRQFVKLISLFSLLLLTLAVLLIEAPEYYLEKRAEFKLTQSPRHIVLGHSHSECSFNDTLINDLVNLSGSGESYFYTYHKAKRVLEQNPSIEIVFIEFTNNQVSPIMDDWTWDQEHMNHRYPKYAPFMSLSDKVLLARNNFKSFISSTSLGAKENVGRILSRNYQYIHETPLNKPTSNQHILDSLILDAKKKGKLKRETQTSKVSIEYLQKIVDVCIAKGKTVVLVRSPLHRSYRGYSNELVYQKIRKKYFSDLAFLDFSKVPLDNSHFYDLEHLNEKGAEVFSTWFNTFLEKNPNLSALDETYLDFNLETNSKNRIE